MIKLSREDFQSYADLLRDLPQFETETGRWRLVNEVLAGSPRERDVRGLLDLSGPPRPAAVSLLSSFLKFGQPEPGKELLGILSNTLLDAYVFDPEPSQFLQGLFERYPLDKPVAPPAPVTDWRGKENPEDVLEKVIGENTLRDVMLLELALEAARSVVRIRTADSLGSGFLCGPDVIMTNHHVIPDAAMAQRSTFMFFYELDRLRRERMVQIIQAVPDGLFFSDSALDVALIQVETPPEGVAPLGLKRERIQRDTRLNIIQHPGGHYKKISMQNNFVEYADAEVVQYTTSTEPGSSGSPVFNNDFEVVAIHHSGGMLADPQSKRRYLRNAGTTMIAVLKAVQASQPELYRKLRLV